MTPIKSLIFFVLMINFLLLELSILIVVSLCISTAKYKLDIKLG